MKSKIKNMLAMYAMAMATTPQNPSWSPMVKILHRDKKNAEIANHKANGLKEFFYGKESLWAMNQKVADKKAKKRGWL